MASNWQTGERQVAGRASSVLPPLPFSCWAEKQSSLRVSCTEGWLPHSSLILRAVGLYNFVNYFEKIVIIILWKFFTSGRPISREHIGILFIYTAIQKKKCFKGIYTFIQKGWIKLLKSYCKYMHNVTKKSTNTCCFFSQLNVLC